MATHDIGLGDEPLVRTRELCAKLHDGFKYIPVHTEVDSPIEDFLETVRGVCRNDADVKASIVRAWAVPCRYVSDYQGPETGEDARGESHTWVACWFLVVGWSGFDPTTPPRETSVTSAWRWAATTRTPPSRGVFRGNGGSVLSTEVRIGWHPG